MNQLTKLPPAWHQDAAQSLKQSFDAIHIDFLNSTRKAVSLGLFLNAIKVRGKEDGSIPHGEFRPWCEKNVPDLNPYTLSTYMTIGRGVIEKAQLEIADFAAFASGSQKIGDLSFAHSGQLPSKVEDLISGKTQSQLLLEFKSEKQPKQHHPIKPQTPDEIIAAENEQAEALIAQAVTALVTITNDLANPAGILAIRIPPKRWKDFLRTAVAVTKAVRPLTKRKQSPAEKQAQLAPISVDARDAIQEAARKRWRNLKRRNLHPSNPSDTSTP